jgi:hypothetical protein
MDAAGLETTAAGPGMASFRSVFKQGVAEPD